MIESLVEQIEARFADAVGATTARGLTTMLDRGLNCPLSSGAGRWFDAAAGALGLSVRQAFEAEAAIALEQLATQALPGAAHAASFAPTLDLRAVVAEMFEVPRDDAAARNRTDVRPNRQRSEFRARRSGWAFLELQESEPSARIAFPCHGRN